MTNESFAIAWLPAEAVNHCTAVADFTLYWGSWFIRLAFFAAIAYVIVGIVVSLLPLFRHPNKGDTRASAVDAGWLNALKGVLEALVNLPAWVAIFLAGFALLWMSNNPPKICLPVASQDSAGKASSPAQQQAGQPQSQAAAH